MEYSNNLNYLLIILFGYLVFGYTQWFDMRTSDIIPVVAVVSIYYILVSVLLRKWAFLQFLFLSFIFMSVYQTFVDCPHADNLWVCYGALRLPSLIYSLVLLPFIFLSMTLDFYALSFESKGIKLMAPFRFLIPVLIKRELVLHRFYLIMDALRAKGYDTESPFGKYRLLPKWIVPLVITTLMEGIEAYEYNKMLQTNILKYRPIEKRYYLTSWQKISLAGLILLSINLLLLHENLYGFIR